MIVSGADRWGGFFVKIGDRMKNNEEFYNFIDELVQELTSLDEKQCGTGEKR